MSSSSGHRISSGNSRTTEPGIGEKGTDTAFNIHPTVGASGAGLRGDGVELVFLLQQVFRHRFQHRAAFNKGHRLQGFTTALNREAARPAPYPGLPLVTSRKRRAGRWRDG